MFLAVELGTRLVWASIYIAGKSFDLSVNYSLAASAQKIFREIFHRFHDYLKQTLLFLYHYLCSSSYQQSSPPYIKLEQSGAFPPFAFLFVFVFRAFTLPLNRAIFFQDIFRLFSDWLVTWGIKAMNPNNMGSGNGTGRFILKLQISLFFRNT